MSTPKPDAATLLRRCERVLAAVADRYAVTAGGVNVKRLLGNLRAWLKEHDAKPQPAEVEGTVET